MKVRPGIEVEILEGSHISVFIAKVRVILIQTAIMWFVS